MKKPKKVYLISNVSGDGWITENKLSEIGVFAMEGEAIYEASSIKLVARGGEDKVVLIKKRRPVKKLKSTRMKKGRRRI